MRTEWDYVRQEFITVLIGGVYCYYYNSLQGSRVWEEGSRIGVILQGDWKIQREETKYYI